MLFANVCAGFTHYCCGVGGEWRFGETLGACKWERRNGRETGSASLHPHVYKARVTQVCLSLDTLLGRNGFLEKSPILRRCQSPYQYR